MNLYYSPGACSLASRIALHEAGLEFQSEKVDLRAKTTASGQDFTAVNRKGYVPALRLLDGQMLTENIAILLYIADRGSNVRLAPAQGSFERYRLLEWLAFVSTEVHKSFSPLFKPTTPEEYKKLARELLGNRLRYVDAQLADKQYLMGQDFTVADAYLITVLRWAPPMKIDLSACPNVLSYIARVTSRPAVRKAFEEEGLTIEGWWGI